jgi:hypothetical protein
MQERQLSGFSIGKLNLTANSRQILIFLLGGYRNPAAVCLHVFFSATSTSDT